MPRIVGSTKGSAMSKLPIPTYSIGSIVYLRANHEQKGMITGYVVRGGGVILYLVTWGDPITETEHWSCELSDDPVFKASSDDE